MINEKITHTIFGTGIVLSIEDNYIKILFDNAKYGEKVFVYPGGFERFLSFENSVLQEKASEVIKLNQKEAREKKELNEAADKKHQDDITVARLEFTKKRTPAPKHKAEIKAKIVKIKKSTDAVVK